MLNASIGQVNLGTSKAFRHDDSNKTIWVKGDGEVEQAAADRFSSSEQIQSIRDPRLNRLFAAEQKLRGEVTDQAQATTRLEEVAHQTLGQGWRVESVFGPLLSATLTHNAEGVTQEVTFELRENPIKVALKTSLIEDGWQIDHRIEANAGDRILPDTAVESAYLTRFA